MIDDSAPGPNRGASPAPRRTADVLVLLGFFVAWVILQAWVLPKCGVST